jgi:glycosyltransferase involved in cell wall biosynthesis
MTFDELLKNPPSCTKIRPETDIFEIKDNFKEWSHVPSQLIFDNIPDFKPTVSIMIPTYRRPALLEEAIESALNQMTEVPFEVVVVDNESDDREVAAQVEAVIKKFTGKNIRYFRNSQNIGMFGNWNRCIELARGKYISILNDDDLLSPEFIEKSSQHLNDNRETGAVVADFIKLQDGREIKIFPNTWLRHLDRRFFWQGDQSFLRYKSFVIGNRIPGTLGVLGRKTAFISRGGFNQNLYPIADYIFWILFSKQHKVYLINEELCTYRWEVNESQRPEISEAFDYCKHIVRSQLLRKSYLPEDLTWFVNLNVSRWSYMLQKSITPQIFNIILRFLVSIQLRILSVVIR